MNHDPLRPHAHEPNLSPPSVDPDFRLIVPGRPDLRIAVSELERLPYTRLEGCYIVSTGHGTSGPFTFGGAALRDFLAHHLGPRLAFDAIEVVGGDSFGTRITAAELAPPAAGTFLLAYELDGRRLSRDQGLVRLIVPQERDDALRQVKWVSAVRVIAGPSSGANQAG